MIKIEKIKYVTSVLWTMDHNDNSCVTHEGVIFLKKCLPGRTNKLFWLPQGCLEQPPCSDPDGG